MVGSILTRHLTTSDIIIESVIYPYLDACVFLPRVFDTPPRCSGKWHPCWKIAISPKMGDRLWMMTGSFPFADGKQQHPTVGTVPMSKPGKQDRAFSYLWNVHQVAIQSDDSLQFSFDVVFQIGEFASNGGHHRNGVRATYCSSAP